MLVGKWHRMARSGSAVPLGATREGWSLTVFRKVARNGTQWLGCAISCHTGRSSAFQSTSSAFNDRQDSGIHEWPSLFEPGSRSFVVKKQRLCHPFEAQYSLLKKKAWHR